MNFIVNNRTVVFKTLTWMFASVLEPSYALTEANEDKSLYLYFAGRGTHTFVKGAIFVTLVCGFKSSRGLKNHPLTGVNFFSFTP